MFKVSTDILLYCCRHYHCHDCPIKPHFKACGNDWHVAYNGTIEQKAAAVMIFMAVALSEEENEEEEE